MQFRWFIQYHCSYSKTEHEVYGSTAAWTMASEYCKWIVSHQGWKSARVRRVLLWRMCWASPAYMCIIVFQSSHQLSKCTLQCTLRNIYNIFVPKWIRVPLKHCLLSFFPYLIWTVCSFMITQMNIYSRSLLLTKLV